MSGRGVWSPRGGTAPATIGGVNYGFYQLWTPNVGSQVAQNPTLDSLALDYRAVWLGVKALQHRLNAVVGSTLVIDGWHGTATDLAVRKAQSQLGLSVGYTAGRVGRDLAMALWRPVVSHTEYTYAIPNHHLTGVIDLESSGDPGAVGDVSDEDKGLAQFHVDGGKTWWNTYFGEVEVQVTIPLAFDYRWAIDQAGRRMAYYRHKFAGKGPDLQAKCSIAQHNAPAWAQTWYDTGTAPNTTIAAYVNAVLTRAASQ